MHISQHDGWLLYSNGPQGKNQQFNPSALQVFVRSSMAKDKECTLLNFVLEQALFSMKELFLSWMNARLIIHRKPCLTVNTKGKLVKMSLNFHSLFRIKCGISIFLPFEFTGDITLMVFPPPLKKKKNNQKTLYSCQCASQPGKMTLGKTHCTERAKMEVSK